MNIRLLKAKIIERGFTVSTLAEACGLSKAVLYRRLIKPEALTVEEVLKITNVLQLTKDEFNHIFFADFVA